MSERTCSPRAITAVAAVVIAASLGALAGRATAPAQRVAPLNERALAAPAPSARGAVRAALDYLDTLRWNVLVDPTRRWATLRRLAEPASAAQLDAELAPQLEPLRAAARVPPVIARPAPLGYRVDRFGERSASVSVWGFVLFATGMYGPVTQWSTSRIELVWRSRRWLVAAVRSRGGPSSESSVRRLASTVRQFREVRHVP